MERRTFLKSAALTIASTMVLSLSRVFNFPAAIASGDLPAGQAAVDPTTDAVANAIGYVADKKKVDTKKYPQAKKPDFMSQSCATCALYTKSNDKWGKCQLIAEGVVASAGWCGSYSKKS